MGNSKQLNYNNIFLFLFLVLFPFGQIIRIGIIHPVDILVGIGALYSVFCKQKRPESFRFFQNFLLIALSSWVFSIFVFRQIEVLYGVLYLFRLVAYPYFLIYVWNFASTSKNKNLLIDSLIGVSVTSAIFGWIQFFIIPDIKPFFEWGWDMHLFRLVGTFLDPTYLGLIIVFGLFLLINKVIDTKNKSLFVIIVFLLISLAFTYSRASYLAFFTGLGYLLYAKKNLGYILYPILFLTLIIPILPTSRNHSIEFFRQFSAIARIDNYKDTIKVFKFSPLFGVGYNNMCLARQKLIGPESFGSHACSGSDSSLLLILATTGVVGFVTSGYSVQGIAYSLKKDSKFQILASCSIALLIHSLFSNSLFYPWIMGYMVILLAISLRREVQN